MTPEQKEKCQTLMTIHLMSSENSGSQASSGSDREASTAGHDQGAAVRKLVRHPLPWRSEEASQVLASLDRKYARKQTDKGKMMTLPRVTGSPSTRKLPSDHDIPEWAMDDFV